MKISVKIGAEFEQSLKADINQSIIGRPIDDSPEELDHDERETEQGNPSVRITARGWIRSQKIVYDDFERPYLEQIQADAEEREQQSDNRLRQKGPVVTKDAPVDRHGNFRLQISNFRLNYTARRQTSRDSSVRAALAYRSE